MVNPETRSDLEKNISEEIDRIIFEAVEMDEFKKIVKEAENKMEAIKNVRVLLKKYFPKVKELDKQDISEEFVIESGARFKKGQTFGKKTHAEFKIAEGVIDLLWK